MKVLISDCSNEGILYVGEDLLVANLLKFGLVDTKIRLLYPANRDYEQVTKEVIFMRDAHFWIDNENILSNLDSQAFNSVYLNRRVLVKLRYPLMEKLINFIDFASKRSKITIWDGFENNIIKALDECQSGSYCSDILEYAHINRMFPEEAYRELRLQTQNIQSLKMRIFAQQQYFVSRINSITTFDQFQPLYEELLDKFFRDSMIG